MKKTLLMVMVALFVVSIAATAFAWPGYVQSRPSSLDLGDSRGYFIWHDDEGYYHIWSSTRNNAHQFSGRIYTNGHFEGVQGKHLESNDWYTVKDRDHEIKFDLNTGRHGEDGLKFHVAGGDHVHFDLFIDGHPVNPQEIRVGHDNWNPDSHNFYLYR